MLSHKDLIALIGTDKFRKEIEPIVAQTQPKPWKHKLWRLLSHGWECDKCNTRWDYYLEEDEIKSECTIPPDPPEGSLADWSYQLRDMAVEKVGDGCFLAHFDSIAGVGIRGTSIMARIEPETVIIAALLALGKIE